MTTNKKCDIKGDSKIDKIEKIDKVINIISKALIEILNHNNDFTGSVTINFCLGGVSEISKKENLKLKRPL